MARFLVVDDEPNTVSALRALLQGDGHAVDAHTSGQAAVEALSTGQFDAVLTDLDMPKVSGRVVLRVAREHHPHACVFVSSAQGAPAGLEAACHVFDKPLDYDRVVQTVERCRTASGPGRHGDCYMRSVVAPLKGPPG